MVIWGGYDEVLRVLFMLKEYFRMFIIIKFVFVRSEIKLELIDEYFEVW